MAKNLYEVSFNSELYKVKAVVLEILGFFEETILGMSYEDKYDLRLIYSELLLNAVVHGNNRDIRKLVTIRIEVTEEVIYSIVTDEGMGFDYIKLISAFDKDSNLLGERGRGIKLVYSLTDSMAFNVTGNEIKFYKRVAING